MRIPKFALTLGLAAMTALGVALPVSADRFWDGGGHHDGINIGIGLGGVGIGVTTAPVRVVQESPQDEAVVFHQWYAEQVRGYTGIDAETGERICDAAQMVTDVYGNYVTVVDESDVTNNIFANNNTQIVFSQDNPVQPTAPNGAPNLTSILRPGDLIIADGHLRHHGGLMAHRIRIVGHVNFGVDDAAAVQPTYGARFWGVVDTVDGAGGSLVIRMDDGRRTVLLDHDGVVWYAGNKQSLNYLRNGDRVIVYGHNRWDDHAAPLAFRVVLLQPTDVFPVGVNPCWADPDGAGVVAVDGGPILEGNVEYITTGTLFDTVFITTFDGHHERIRFPHRMGFYDGHGHQVSPLNLHAGSALRVHYSDIGGNHFAQHVEVKEGRK